MQIEYGRPFGATACRSGSANVVVPLPPYVVPNNENKAVFWLMASSCPLAGVPFATEPAVRMTSPSVQSRPRPDCAQFVLAPKPVAVPAGPVGPLAPLWPGGPGAPFAPPAPVGPGAPLAPAAPP